MKSDSIKKLHLLCGSLANYANHSRIHRLKMFSHTAARCYVKREDELSFGVSGSKLRKFLSIIPYCLSHNIKKAVVIGGAYSNHVLAASQLLIENSINPQLFLLKAHQLKRTGNYLLTSLLVPAESITWISRNDWPQVHRIVEQYVAANTLVIPEGACMTQALPGALTLALDILRNQQEHNLIFDHIFIDAGTGMMVIAVILVFHWLQMKTHIHVVLLAGDEEKFYHRIYQLRLLFEDLIEETIAEILPSSLLSLYRPCVAPAFGATNQLIFESIKHFLRHEGIITDPIYSAKLFLTAEKVIIEKSLTGNILLIHSGGGFTLMGFETDLAKHCD